MPDPDDYHVKDCFDLPGGPTQVAVARLIIPPAFDLGVRR